MTNFLILGGAVLAIALIVYFMVTKKEDKKPLSSVEKNETEGTQNTPENPVM